MSETFFGNDTIALLNSYDGNEIIQAFTLQDVERFLLSLGVGEIDVQDDYLICPTICHNPIDQAESMKLYYYDKTKNFHCYTQCSENFSIVTLYQRYMEINHQKVSYDEALYYLKQFIVLGDEMPEPQTISKIETYTNDDLIERKSIITLPEIKKTTLDLFVPHYYHPLWSKEQIKKESQDKFDIRFSYGQNKIIIPHYDINGRLIGIRSRAIDEEDLQFGKYRPAQFGSDMYNHQLGFNLYGLWEHKSAIQLTKRAIIYEGEKSVMIDDSFYGPYSVAVATCGSQLNRFQINLLIQKLGVNEIILAYDKEYDEPYSPQGKAYREKLIQKCERYRGLASFYYIFDEHNLLDKKDAPCDKGQEVLETLMKRRIKIK